MYYKSLFTFTYLTDAFIQSDSVYSGYTFIVSMCVPWESNPQPFTVLTQCSATEPQEHFCQKNKWVQIYIYLFIYIYIFFSHFCEFNS